MGTSLLSTCRLTGTDRQDNGKEQIISWSTEFPDADLELLIAATEKAVGASQFQDS